MTTPIDHETCSELLRAYVLGEAGTDRPAVAAHLEVCERCRTERSGLERLLAPIPPLTEAERSRIHFAVRNAGRAESSQAPAELHAVPDRDGDLMSGRPGTGSPQSQARQPRWIAPVLSAAAAVILIVSGIALLGHGVSGPSALRTATDQGSGANGGGHEANTAVPEAGAGPHFASSPLTGIHEVRRRATRTVQTLSGAYDRKAARHGLATGFLDQLAQRAPPSVRRQILGCGGEQLSTAGSRALLPAYGAITSAGDKRSLVLVFASSGAGEARPSGFEIYAWPLGSCDVRPSHSSGKLPAG